VSSPGLPAGTRFGDFVAVRPLAAGGMAELYLAARPVEGGPPQLAAIKRLLPHLGWDPEFVRMFLDEVRIAASLHHPNIVRVLDFGVGEGGHYLAMEYLHGRTLRAVQRSVRAAGPLPLGFAVGTIVEIAVGLHAAHEHRDAEGNPVEVVHRDVSPSNVMVTFDGDVKLVDFGIARVTEHTQLTRAGTLKGKMGYMSPEQCRGERVDRRSDVFGLGILLYELTVGRRAFYADNDYAVIGKVVDGDYLPPHRAVQGYPPELSAVVARALEVEPDDRYPTAAALVHDLQQVVAHAGLDVSIPTRAATLSARFGYEPMPVVDLAALRPPPSPARAGWLRWAALAGAGTCIGVVAFLAGGLMRSPEGEADAESQAAVGQPAVGQPAVGQPGPREESAAAPVSAVSPPVGDEPPADDDAVIELDDDDPALDDASGRSQSSSPRRRARARRRARRAPSSPTPDDPSPSANPDPLLPPTWRER